MSYMQPLTSHGFDFTLISSLSRNLSQDGAISFNPKSKAVSDAIKNKSPELYLAIEAASKALADYQSIWRICSFSHFHPLNYRFPDLVHSYDFSKLEELKNDAIKVLALDDIDDYIREASLNILAVLDGSFIAPPLTANEQEERDARRFERQKPKLKKELIAAGEWSCANCATQEGVCITLKSKDDEDKYSKENIRLVCRKCRNKKE